MSGSLVTSQGQIAGITQCRIDGVNYNVTDYSWNRSTKTRETMTSLSGIDGHSARWKAGFIEVTLRDFRNISIPALQIAELHSVTLLLANGKQISGHDMWVVGDVDVGAEATGRVRFEGTSVTESGGV